MIVTTRRVNPADEVDGRPARVAGWYYDTLEGHFEEGRMHYEVWKWLDSGEVQFRLYAISRGARTGPWVLRTGNSASSGGSTSSSSIAAPAGGRDGSPKPS